VTAPAKVTVKDYVFKPPNLQAAQDQVVRWMFQGPSAHTATDSIGLGVGGAPLFDSGSKGAGGVYEFAFKAAGIYPYWSTAPEPSPMTGTIKVPLVVSPVSGSTNTGFALRWSSSTLPGFRFSVQYRFQPQGSSTWSKWASFGPVQTAPAATFTPDRGAGTYQFRSRLENEATGRTSQFSSPASIAVA
jgi:plastocyanin